MAESEGDVVFGSLQEELEYWKEKALEYRQRYINCNQETVVGKEGVVWDGCWGLPCPYISYNSLNEGLTGKVLWCMPYKQSTHSVGLVLLHVVYGNVHT